MSRCSVCDHSCKVVLGDGPQPCPVMFIGEKPGYEEASRGRPFIGATGEEFNWHYLGLAGLSRDEIRISNSLKCRLGHSNDKPTEPQVRACAGHWIPLEMDRCEPSVIVLMGATACSLVGLSGGDPVELDKEHGIPRWVELAGNEGAPLPWDGWVVPMFHPASGLHDTSQMTPIMEDFTRLGKWLRGSWTAPVDDGVRDYKLVESVEELDEDMSQGGYRFLPVDTEDDSYGEPWSLQYSVKPGHGRMIRADRKDLLDEFLYHLHWEREGLLLHFANHDINALERMYKKIGVEWDVAGRPYRDTMQEAFHLRTLPQGLKALGYRLFGIRMRDYVDVVEGWSKRAMREWLGNVWLYESDPKHQLQQVKKYKKPRRDKLTGELVNCRIEFRPNEWERLAKWILDHGGSETYNMWEKAEEKGLANRYIGVEEIGPMPRKGIEHVPIDEAVRYGCEDADVTGRVGGELERRRGEIVGEGGEWWVPELDWDHSNRVGGGA